MNEQTNGETARKHALTNTVKWENTEKLLKVVVPLDMWRTFAIFFMTLSILVSVVSISREKSSNILRHGNNKAHGTLIVQKTWYRLHIIKQVVSKKC